MFAYTQLDVRTRRPANPIPTPSLVRHPIHIVTLAFAAILVALAVAGPASASTPCWKTLIDDWYDGRIDNVYPVSCYRDALENLPEDVAQYSSLEDDINRALAAAVASGGTAGPPPPSSGSAGSTFRGGPRAGGRGVGPIASAGRDPGKGPVRQAINSLGGDSADSVPIPLIVLGALAIVLLALGTAGVIARRLQMRKATVRPSARA